MAQAVEPSVVPWTVGDLFERFGPIPLYRIRMEPAPGSATEADVVRIHDREGRLCELVDGVLVEKDMGVYESYLAGQMYCVLNLFVKSRKLGMVLAPDGMMRLAPGLVRIPDVSFVGIARLSSRKVPDVGMLDHGPDLAVEIISRGNTKKEMQTKLDDYFDGGARLVWYVYPKNREVHVYRNRDECTVLTERDRLDGGEVLPDFLLELRDFFSQDLGGE
jgi:Uma2 family endonuclease